MAANPGSGYDERSMAAAVYEQLKTSPPTYHVAFNAVLNLTEALVTGHEDL